MPLLRSLHQRHSTQNAQSHSSVTVAMAYTRSLPAVWGAPAWCWAEPGAKHASISVLGCSQPVSEGHIVAVCAAEDVTLVLQKL